MPQAKKQTVAKTNKNEEQPEKKLRAPRKKVTQESFTQEMSELIEFLDNEIETMQKEQKPGIRKWRKVRANLVKLRGQVPKIAGSSRRLNNLNKNKVSGFSKPCEITPELRKFLKLENGVNPSRKEITQAITVYVNIKPDENREHILKWKHLNPKGRNLQNPENKTEIIPDAALKKILRYSEYEKDVKAGKVTALRFNKNTREKEEVVINNPALRYCTIQKLIQPQIIGQLEES